MRNQGFCKRGVKKEAPGFFVLRRAVTPRERRVLGKLYEKTGGPLVQSALFIFQFGYLGDEHPNESIIFIHS